MKEFDKWLTEQFEKESFPSGDWVVAESGWRAALEWVLKLGRDDGFKRNSELEYVIEQELEN